LIWFDDTAATKSVAKKHPEADKIGTAAIIVALAEKAGWKVNVSAMNVAFLNLGKVII